MRPHLNHARLGDSRLMQVGDFVLAVGSPFGLTRSITFGIISAKNRRKLDLGNGQGKRGLVQPKLHPNRRGRQPRQ